MKLRYNLISLKPWQCPASVSRLCSSPPVGKRAFTCAGIRPALGELGNGNVPAAQGCESSPAFIGGFQSQNLGGHHA